MVASKVAYRGRSSLVGHSNLLYASSVYGRCSLVPNTQHSLLGIARPEGARYAYPAEDAKHYRIVAGRTGHGVRAGKEGCLEDRPVQVRALVLALAALRTRIHRE